jgi:hypothetical protein
MQSQYLDLLETLDPSAARKYKIRERAAQSALEYERLKNSEPSGARSKQQQSKGRSKKKTSHLLQKKSRLTSTDIDESRSDGERSEEEFEKSSSRRRSNPKKSRESRLDLAPGHDRKSVEETVLRKFTIQAPPIRVQAPSPPDTGGGGLPQAEQESEILRQPNKNLQPYKRPAPTQELVKKNSQNPVFVPTPSPERDKIVMNVTDNDSPAESVAEENIELAPHPERLPSPASSDDHPVSDEHPDSPLDSSQIPTQVGEDHGLTWPQQRQGHGQKEEEFESHLPPSQSESALLAPSKKSEILLPFPHHDSTTGMKTLTNSLTFGTGNISVDSLALDPNQRPQQNKAMMLMKSKDQKTNQSIEDHEDLFERSESKFRQSADLNTTASQGDRGDDADDGSFSELEMSLYLPLQQDTISETPTHRQDNELRKKHFDQTGGGANRMSAEGVTIRVGTITGLTGNTHCLQSEVMNFLREEELLHQNENNNSPDFRQTFHSKNENDDVLLGTNLLQGTYGTLSSFDSDTLNTPPPQRKNSSSPPVVGELPENSVEDFLFPHLSGHPNAPSGQETEMEEGNPHDTSRRIIRWSPGRAPLELIETALALDIFVSAVRFDSTSYSSKVLLPSSRPCPQPTLFSLCFRFGFSSSSWNPSQRSLSRSKPV